MADSIESPHTKTNVPTETKKNQIDLVQIASKLFDNNSKAALVVLGGLSVAALAYKAYKTLPKPHPSLPTAPDLHPILGHVPFYTNNYNHLHDSFYALLKNQPIMAFKLPDFYQVFIQTPELIEWVFTTEFDKFWKSREQEDRFSCLFGKYGQGIFFSDDDDWRFHRKIGSRMFSVRNVRDYMYNCCITTTNITLTTLEKLRTNQQMIDINDILGRMTFDCFTSIAFGKSFDSMSLYPTHHPFGYSFDKVVEILPKRSSEPFWKIKRFLNIDYEKQVAKHLKVLNEFSHDLVTEKRKNAIAHLTDETGKKTFDLFTLYQQHNAELTDEDMKFLALNFIIAGRDTTRTLTSWFLYDLANYSDVKKKIIAEIDDYKSDKINYNDITTKFKYLEATLCESLRYHPVVPTSSRRARKDILIPNHILPGNYVIKKGDVVTIHQFTIAKLESFYKDPFTFDPMRFYEKGVRTFKHSVYPFFNQFPRLCLGRDFALMEVKIFVFNFLRKYDFEVVEKEKVTYLPGIIFNMKNGLKIKLKLRE